MRPFNSLVALPISVLLFANTMALAQVAPAPVAPVAAPEVAPVAEPVVAPPAQVVVTEPAPVATKPEPETKLAAKAAPMKISLYGFFQLNTIIEGGANENRAWSIWLPKKSEDGESRIALNVNQTRIGINVSGEPKEGGPEVLGKFEVDWSNDNNRNNNGVGSLRIRQAFGQVKFNDIGLSLLLGQTSDLIGSLTAPSVNQGTLQGQGSLGTRRPMIRATQALGPVEIAAAVTDNRDVSAYTISSKADTAKKSTYTSPQYPAFQYSLKGKVPASWAGAKQNVELTLGGHYASREVAANDSAGVARKDGKDTNFTYNKPPTSWSYVASLSLPVISIVNLSGEFFYGQDLWSYSAGTIQQSNAVSKRASKAGVQSTGGWGAANIKLPANFALVGGYGVEAICKSRELADGRVKNQVIFSNLRYFVDDAAYIAFEYANLLTRYATTKADVRTTDSGKMNRYELVFNYAFK
ncbi:MAG: hypothetical protein LBC64_09825 [Fibromonadaceae bacterium]|jgi:hypothetical protein|nr:hypothetical protein [Fibromonadaceae bacterium]